MIPILCVGNAVLDLVFTLPRLPARDEELRATALRVAAGGNAANTARVLRGLGHQAALAAALPDHPAGTPLEEELLRAGVDISPCRRVHGLPPLSAVLLSGGGAHRAVVHHRSIPEYSPADFSRLDLSRWGWAHFEARPGTGTVRMIRDARRRRPDLPISLEVEKLRPGIGTCFPLARLVLFSRSLVEACGYGRPEPFLREVRRRVPATLLSATWGEEGAWAIEADATLHHSRAHAPSRAVDTLGAGDTFNAGIIGALAEGRPLREALGAACRLAGHKVGRQGLQGLRV